ncbi:HIT family protein [Antrihabitans cavernicola]|uniref:HIT family protein n=1 Tax=Antrihabitans cavernicola TaxID=2495913 RepID=A0A5A7SAC1_9NOCA|nr:HIT family protein [Spelaeibacter cavernicola]KAA0022434.1 HIT family protein [Spelaeibacter cavernicola]
MTSCIFCSIVAGDAPSTRVYEDDDILAFLDVRPILRGHTLVIPKTHAAQLDELDPELGARMFRVGHRLANAVRHSELAADGANLLVNDGKSAFQTVAHTHLHVLPRHNSDKLRFARGLILRPNKDPEGAAAAIRSALQRTESTDD